jgi:glyoxylase-like metal-dependent hydrolase (beta-lactamase superfamily II)
MTDIPVYRTSAGSRIYRIPLHLFPGLEGWVHLVVAGEVRALVDCGSGFGESDDMLAEGMAEVRRQHGEQVDWADLTHVLITHGHIDHFGGLGFVRRISAARVGVHELDVRVLTHYEDRLAFAARRLWEFLVEAGLEEDRRREFLDLYLLHKHLFRSVEVDFTLQASGMRLGPLTFAHTPGHAAGHVVIRIDDVLLAGDHVLKGVSPHLGPERLHPFTGLSHYLASLERTRALAPEVGLTLSGHGEPIEDLAGRIDQILSLHSARLRQVLALAETPVRIADITQGLFPQAAGYHGLLAIEEAGAHVEFLAVHGYLGLTRPGGDGRPGEEALTYLRVDHAPPGLPPLESWPANLRSSLAGVSPAYAGPAQGA